MTNCMVSYEILSGCNLKVLNLSTVLLRLLDSPPIKWGSMLYVIYQTIKATISFKRLVINFQNYLQSFRTPYPCT